MPDAILAARCIRGTISRSFRALATWVLYCCGHTFPSVWYFGNFVRVGVGTNTSHTNTDVSTGGSITSSKLCFISIYFDSVQGWCRFGVIS